jgi:hypothetical protein
MKLNGYSWIAVLFFGVTSALADGEFNRRGNILITDQFNNRVIEINRSGKIVWHFGNGPNDESANSIIGTNDAERVGEFTLMAGTGIPGPSGTPPTPVCPTALCQTGAVDNRVLLVDEDGKIVWQYGQFGVTGSGPDQLNTPVQNTFLPNRRVLITDQGNERIIEVRHNKTIAWQYGQTGVTGNGPGQLNNPNAAELLENGHILIADENNNRAIEVTHKTPSTVVHTYTQAGGVLFSGVAFASRLPNGHTLITDSNSSRIVETDETGADFWHYFTNTDPNSNPSPLPTRAVRLANGNTLISDQFNDRVIEVSHPGNIVASYGNLNQPGFGTQKASQGMDGPYSAYKIGDYTGLTPPFAEDNEDD